MTGLWERWAPHVTAVMALYALTVCLVLLVSGWVEPWWLASAIVVWLVAMVGYTVWKVQERRQRQWQRQQDRQVSE